MEFEFVSKKRSLFVLREIRFNPWTERERIVNYTNTKIIVYAFYDNISIFQYGYLNFNPARFNLYLLRLSLSLFPFRRYPLSETRFIPKFYLLSVDMKGREDEEEEKRRYGGITVERVSVPV